MTIALSRRITKVLGEMTFLYFELAIFNIFVGETSGEFAYGDNSFKGLGV